ncbi:MAG: YciI family protein [candidate division Zixibacteria bacterium]|nr:YciI family protein [candidate division Zixibacteria bacterium]
MASEYLYRLVPTRLEMLTEGPTQLETELVTAHFAYLQDAVAKGTLLLAGRTTLLDERTFGIAVFKAETEEEARCFMENDPAVAGGVMHAELFPFRVALLAEDWVV